MIEFDYIQLISERRAYVFGDAETDGGVAS